MCELPKEQLNICDLFRLELTIDDISIWDFHEEVNFNLLLSPYGNLEIYQ